MYVKAISNMLMHLKIQKNGADKEKQSLEILSLYFSNCFLDHSFNCLYRKCTTVTTVGNLLEHSCAILVIFSDCQNGTRTKLFTKT